MTTIRISPGQFADSARLVHNSALQFCATIDGDDAGLYVEAERPVAALSSGEQLLWQVLAWLNGVGELPSTETLRAGLDDSNLFAVTSALASQKASL